MGLKLLLFLALVIIVPAIVSSKNKSYARLKAAPLSRTRCDLACLDADVKNKTVCRTQWCDDDSKPGTCPRSSSPQWEAACVQECDKDNQCHETQKCCRYGCGSTCSEPVDLLTLPGLPPIPVIAGVVEKRKSTMIQWSDGVGDAARAVPGRTLYILQEQHHFGPKYEESLMGTWNLLLRTNKTKVSLKKVLKPGRWYRFRVAAVSVVGTRGYSNPSVPFTPRKGPRPPPPPRRLKVTPLKSDNTSVAIRLEWKEPRSDLPVLRYKVYWSRRVRGLSADLDSVFVNHQTVPKDQTYFDITDLQPNSMYFLQVQTISQYGTGKLRSTKAEIFYNTNSTVESQQKPKNRVKGLKLQKILWHNNKIKARMSWKDDSRKESRRYLLKWRTVKCKNRPGIEFSVITSQKTYDIHDLDYNCSYKVSVSPHKSKSSARSELQISVPGCEYFLGRILELEC